MVVLRIVIENKISLNDTHISAIFNILVIIFVFAKEQLLILLLIVADRSVREMEIKRLQLSNETIRVLLGFNNPFNLFAKKMLANLHSLLV